MNSLRLDDWQARLIDYVGQQTREPFAYGRNDCALFTAGAVKAMTGQDPAVGLRGYRSLKAGEKKLSEKGFADHVAVAASMFEEVPPAMAQVGDIAVVPGDDGLALGIVQGEAVYLLRRDGVGLVSILSAVRAFRV